MKCNVTKLPQILVLLALLCVLCVPVGMVQAQGGGDGGDDDAPAVLVTTQDYASLRTGPGQSFPRVAVVDPAVELPAVGRSVDTRWVQVAYQGQLGWIHVTLLVWIGDILQLPVDGLYPAPYVRKMLVTGITTRETPLYEHEVTPSDQIGLLPEGVEVEVTGRLGGPTGMYQLQIRHEGALYWVGSWNIRILDGAETRLLNNTYRYAYGRLVTALDRDITSVYSTLNRVANIWLRLQAGERVRCDIPGYARRNATGGDIDSEPKFIPLVSALDAGIKHTNAAISAFEDACGRAADEGFFLEATDVTAALDTITIARHNLNIANALLSSLKVRDPLLGNR
ncbi:MAG: SH3 domain-containing protein [Anaerolineae bacterium]|nr:SH3 domain-containing protein [Anaerolineae bacterium]